MEATRVNKKRPLQDPVATPAPTTKKKRKKARVAAAAPAPVPADQDYQSLLGYSGAKQQGKISTVMGKVYEGPRSMEGKRAEQVARHLTNLVLNRLTAEAPMSATGKQEKPVEVQLSLVGGRILINSNNPAASRELQRGIKEAGSLAEYVAERSARTPAMDMDFDRPTRQWSKLKDAFEGTRHWQQAQRKAGETDADIKRATAILNAAKTASGKGGAILFDQAGDPAELARQVAHFSKNAGSVGVVIHRKGGVRHEHAERVQSDFREAYLKHLEDLATSAPPRGPKTPCFGCAVHQEVNHPRLGPSSAFSGAYFHGSSPVITPAERRAAAKRARSHPATGSRGQSGHKLNSDEPQSDTDDEGNEVFPRPVTLRVPYSGKPPGPEPWEVAPGVTKMFARNKKRADVIRAQERAARKKRK